MTTELSSPTYLNFFTTLRNWSLSPQAENDLQIAFGDALDWSSAYRHLSALQGGDFSLLPEIKILSGQSMADLWGGYSRDLRVVFLSADCPEDLIVSVLLEEIGHFFDQELCSTETPGDEGAVFSALVLGESIATCDHFEDEFETLLYAGVSIPVEAASKKRFRNNGGGAKSRGSSGSRSKMRGVGSSRSSTSSSAGGEVIYANQDSVRLVQTQPGQILVGSAGDDTFVVKESSVKIENPGRGTDTIETNVSFNLANYGSITNLVLVGSSNINGAGNKRANIITGNSGNNILSGDEGNDTIIGGSGNDTLFGGEGNDSLFAGEGADSLYGGSGEDTIFGGGGDDTLIGGLGNDYLDANAGNNSLVGGIGNDTMTGGSGNDSYLVDSTADVVIDSSGTDTIFSTDQSLSLGNYSNIEHIVFIGTSGSDSMTGGAGAGTLMGGQGHDTYYIDHIGDSVLETDSSTLTGGVDWVVTSLSHSLQSNTENIIKSGTANASLTGNNLDNIIDGSSGGLNTLRGSGGDDTLIVDSARIGVVDGGSGTNYLKVLGDSLSFNDKALTNIHVLDLSEIGSTLNVNSGVVIQNPVTGQLASLVGYSRQASVEVTLGANSGSLRNIIGHRGSDSITVENDFGIQSITLNGGAGGDRFEFSSANQMAAASLYGESGDDTLAYQLNTNLNDGDFLTLLRSSIEVLELSGSDNGVTLGANAETAGIATIVGGTDNDRINASGYTEGVTIDVSRNRAVEGDPNTENTVVGGSAGDLVLFANHNVLSASSIDGASGIDTLRFAENSVAITDEKFNTNIQGIEVIQTNDGHNFIQLGTLASASSLESVIGGAGGDTFDATEFTRSIAIDAGDEDDSITLKNGATVGSSAIEGGQGKDTLALAEAFEEFTDTDRKNGTWDADEVLTLDLNSNGIWDAGDTFTDTDRKNGIWDAAEILTLDLNSNGSYDVGDTFTDSNANGTWDAAEAFTDSNLKNGTWDGIGLLLDEDLSGVTGIEVLQAADSGSNQITIGQNAEASGISVVIGGQDNDILDARDYSGALSLSGGGGDDGFLISAGFKLRSQAVDGGSGTDTLSFTGDALSVTDTDLALATSIEFLQTANGNNRITLGASAQAAGIAYIQGGTGRDTLSASGFTTNVTLISGTGKTAALLGDSLIGGAAADSLVGSDKADVLNGGAGIDTMVGGLGNDTYYIGDDGDRVFDTVDGGANLLIVGQEVEIIDVNIIINQNGDAIRGNTDGGTVVGGGNTTFRIQGLVSILGTTGNDSITGNTSSLNNAGQVMKTTPLNDTIDGGLGKDTIAGGRGKDYLLGGLENDSLLGEDGNDTLRGGDDNDIILAGAGNDSVLGEEGNDSLVAGTGIDTLDGGNGNDTFVADAAGTSRFLGGFGSDVFQFSTPSLVGLNTIEGDDGSDTLSTDTISLSGGGALADSAFLNVSAIEVLDASGLNASSINASLGANAQDAGISTLTGSNQTDFLSAAEYNSGTIWIRGFSGVTSAGDSLVAGSGNNRSTLLGSNGSDYFEVGLASLLGNHSIEGGSGNDTLFIKNIAYGQAGWNPGDQVLSGGDFSKVRNIEALRYDNRYQNTMDFRALGSGASLAAAFSGDIYIFSTKYTNPIDTFADDASDVIDLSGITSKKVNLDVSHEVFGATITAGAMNGTLRGGSGIFANDMFIFKQASWLAGANVVGGGGQDTLRIQGNGNNGAAAIDTKNFTIDIDVLDITGAGNEIILTPKTGNSDITTVVGGSGPNTFTAASYTGLGAKSLYWDMRRSDGGDSIVGAATNDYFQIRNGFNLRNSSLHGGASGTDTLELLSGGETLGDVSFDNAANMDILILGSATNGNNITLGDDHAQVAGIATVIGGTARDTIIASSYTQGIYIDASASSGAILRGSSSSDTNTLIGGSAGGNEFEIGDLGSNSIVGGLSGVDNLTFVNAANISDLIQNGQINDGSTASFSNIGVLKFTGNNNTVTLGKDALAAGIRTLVGGEGSDYGSSFDTTRYGTVGVLFQVTDQFYLKNSQITGSAGVDTLKFSRDGVSVTDENVTNLTDIDVIQTANGTNRFLMHDVFDDAGIDSIIGGTGTNIIDMMSTLYDPFNNPSVADFDDVITFDMSRGSYSLLVRDVDLRYAKVVGGASGGSVSITNVNGVVVDQQFKNLYDAKISSVTYSSGIIYLGKNATASGLKTLRIADSDAYVSDFNAPLVVNTSGVNTDERVFTSFAALADLTFNGGAGSDTLVIEESEARAITSLKGDFDVLVLEDGENFVKLGNDAGLSAIVGGRGADTLNFLDNTTGINFVMNASVLGNTDFHAQISGGTGRDTISVNFVSTGNTFVDAQLARVSLGQSGADTLNGFSTDADGWNTYTFGTQFRSNLIQNIFAHANDTINASAVTNRELNFAFGSVSDFQSSTIVGTAANDTLTLNITAPASQAIADTDFGPVAAGVGLKTAVDTLVLISLASNAHADFTVALGTNAETAGIRTAVGGNGSDSLDASAMTEAVVLSGGVNVRLGSELQPPLIDDYTILQDTLVGGSGSDSLYGDNFYDSLVGGNGADTLTGTSSTALGANEIDTLTGDVGSDLFVLGDASNAYYNTGGRGSDYALITDFTPGADKIRLKDLSSLYTPDPISGLRNEYGYLLSSNNAFSVDPPAGAGRYYLYADVDKNGAVSSQDNLIAVINSSAVLTTSPIPPAAGSSSIVNTNIFTIV